MDEDNLLLSGVFVVTRDMWNSIRLQVEEAAGVGRCP